MKKGSHETMKHEDGESHHEMMVRDFRKRFIISGIITIPVLILSPTIQGWLGYSIPETAFLKWLLFILASLVAIWGAKPFYYGAAKELKKNSDEPHKSLATAITKDRISILNKKNNGEMNILRYQYYLEAS